MQRLRTVTLLDVSAVAGHHAMPAALLLAIIIEAGSMGGVLKIFIWYPLLAASLEIYSIYVKHETASGE